MLCQPHGEVRGLAAIVSGLRIPLSTRGELPPASALQPALPHELAVPAVDFNFFFGGLYSAYVRGQAYLATHESGEAAIEFQKIIVHRGLVAADPIGALTHLQLGKTYAIAGDKTKARSSYQDFLALWKDADSDLSVLKQARSEYAQLQ